MATGPLPSSGLGWNLHKTKDAIFAHLNEYGITMNLAKQLLSLDESDGITKENGLNLITLMNTEITETNVLTSPWDLVASIVQSEMGATVEAMESPGARLSLIPKWVEHILRGKEAASGFTKSSVPEDVAPLGEGGSSMDDVSHLPPLPDPPRVIPGAPSSKVDVPAPSDPEVENLLSSLAAAEAKIANSRAALAASAAALDIESGKAIAAEATYHSHHVKKQRRKRGKEPSCQT